MAYSLVLAGRSGVAPRARPEPVVAAGQVVDLGRGPEARSASASTPSRSPSRWSVLADDGTITPLLSDDAEPRPLPGRTVARPPWRDPGTAVRRRALSSRSISFKVERTRPAPNARVLLRDLHDQRPLSRRPAPAARARWNFGCKPGARLTNCSLGPTRRWRRG